MRSIKFAKHKILLIPLSMLAVTLIAGYFLSHIPLGANAVTTSDVSLRVKDTCTMDGNVTTDDSNMLNGQEREGFHVLSLTTYCNDNAGFSIYAVGYSGDLEGSTDLTGVTTGLTISTADWADRNTGDNATKSIYSLKIEKDNTSYLPGNISILNGFTNYLAVPSTNTKVASYSSNTDTTTGSTINANYAVKVANLQAADTYTGKVKYTMVHPSSNTATGFTFDDAFQLAGKTRVSGTSYFAMQDMNAAICNKVTTNQTSNLIDIRDNQVYAVGKLADDNCWLLDNLRLGAEPLLTALSISNTNMSPNVNFTLPASGTANFDSANGYTNAAINTSLANTDATYRTDYTGEVGKIGVFYNYCAASAGTICAASDSNNNDATYDICPAGWKLPAGNTSKGSYSYLYTNSTEGYNSNQANFTNALRTPLSGSFSNGQTQDQGSNGYFWSSTRFDGTYMYRLRIDGLDVRPQGYDNRHVGVAVRCIADSSMQGFSTDAAASLAINESIQLRDVRDGKEYWVTKLADGNVWMTQNLDLDLDSNVALTNADTDLNSVTSWTPIRSTIDSTNYGDITTCSSQSDAGTGCRGQTNRNFAPNFSSDSTTTDMTVNANNSPYSANPGYRYMIPKILNTPNPEGQWYANGDTFANCSTQDTNCGGQGHYMIGNYYNFAAANATNSVAGTVGHTITDSDADFVMLNSICPKGWRMPKGQSSNNDFTTLFTKYNIVGDGAFEFNYQGLNAVRRAPLYFVRSGSVDGGTLGSAGVDSLVWSSTISAASYGRYLGFGGISVSPASSYVRQYGFAVRCLLRTE